MNHAFSSCGLPAHTLVSAQLTPELLGPAGDIATPPDGNDAKICEICKTQPTFLHDQE
jgi:hypothetical protein